MRDLIYTVMTDHAIVIIFLHVLSAAIWLGGLVALLVLSRKAKDGAEIERRFSGRAALFKKLFKFLAFFVIVLFITALIMALGYRDNAIDTDGFIIDNASYEIYKYINMKGILFVVMVMNMLFTIWIITKAECRLCKTRRATDCMWLVNTYLLPINIILGIVAIYLGVVLENMM